MRVSFVCQSSDKSEYVTREEWIDFWAAWTDLYVSWHNFEDAMATKWKRAVLYNGTD